MTLQEWLEEGRKLGFCGDVFCYSHGYPELFDSEGPMLLDDDEVCVFVARVYLDNEKS